MRSNWRHVVFLQKMSVFISSSKSHGKRDVSQSVPWFAWRRLLSSMKAMGHPFLNQDWTPWEYSHNFSDLFISCIYCFAHKDVCTADLWRSEEAIGAPGTGVMDDVIWVMYVGAGNQIWVPCRNKLS